MPESRTELITWVNRLLATQYIKVEQLGTGIAYSQIIDSIYGDVPLTKLKFKAKHEYEFIDNYKILQRSFEKHKIDKIIPVQRLVKCRFQDNLEFLQWIKLYWDTTAQRQKSLPSPLKLRHGRQSSDLVSCTSLSSTSSTLETPTEVSFTSLAPAKKQRIQSPSYNHIIMDLQQQLDGLKGIGDSLGVEKDFYRRKLDKIKQAYIDHDIVSTSSSSILKKIGTILYG
ncbi:calponin homology domain-containing protein [Chlamydoabsidia padenii]|nr:calponin homology domain-containing protein [Chlamydoabsidia padenii]